MNIRPKIQIFSGGGLTGVGRNTDDWYNNIFISGDADSQSNHVLEMLTKYGDNYMNWVNGMQSAHAKIYNEAGGEKGNWKSAAYNSSSVKDYQKNFATNPYTDYNYRGINNAFTNRIFSTPGKRITGDNPTRGYTNDGAYSSITDFRRILGRKGDWTDEQLNSYKQYLNKIGYDIDLDTDNYYKIKKFGDPNSNEVVITGKDKRQYLSPLAIHPGIPDGPQPPDNLNLNLSSKLQAAILDLESVPEKKKTFWNNLQNLIHKNGANLLEYGRLAGTLINNNKIYEATKAGIIPNLQQSYHTYRNIIGDEATRNAFYTKAVEGENRAARPITSDADKNVAYRQEAKRIGDQLRIQGDIADNQEIRRTSDESNEHAWRNVQRDTDVANANRLELNRVSSALANLKAQKIAADWTAIDNQLLAEVNNWKQNQQKSKYYQDQIFALSEQDRIENDPQLRNLREQLYDIYKNNNGNTYDQKYINKMREVKSRILQLNKESLERRQNYELGILTAKSGTKLTQKQDLLYKTIRDSVDHFRKMSKMADDSRTKNKGNKVKLIPHPSKKTRRMQQGGIAPFLIHRPAALGGENTISTQDSGTRGSSSESSKKEKDNSLDFIKDLFGKIMSNEGGLPIDVQMVSSRVKKLMDQSQIFGTELSTSDIQGLYLSSMYELVNAKHGKELWKQAQQQAYNNNALNEYAINELGQVAVQVKDTNKLQYMDWDNIKQNRDKVTPLTNQNLLNLRAYSPALAFDYSVLETVGNGVGMSKIAEFLKNQLPNIGSNEETIEGYTKQDSINIKEGIKLLQDAPPGDYKYTQYNKTQQKQYQMALKYLARILPENMKTILTIHADKQGVTPMNLIEDMIGASISNNSKLEFDAVKASKDDSDSLDKITSNPLLAMQREIGGMYQNYSLVTKDSNTKLSVNGTFYSQLPKISEDMSIDKMLSVSGIGGIIQGKRGITFGNQEIKPEDLKHIMYSNNGGMVVTLPCKIVNGIKQVNLDVVETYEKAEQKALQVNSDRNSPQFIQALAQELKNEHLDSLLDSNGLPNKNMFGQFLVVDAYASDKIKFDTNSKYIEKIENPDEELEQRMSKALSTDNKKSEYALDVKDHWTIFEGTWDDIYKGTVFIPLNNNPNAALNTWGNSAKIGRTTELEELYQISNKSSKFNGNNTLE